jgi:hypothetical protein
MVSSADFTAPSSNTLLLGKLCIVAFQTTTINFSSQYHFRFNIARGYVSNDMYCLWLLALTEREGEDHE